MPVRNRAVSISLLLSGLVIATLLLTGCLEPAPKTGNQPVYGLNAIVATANTTAQSLTQTIPMANFSPLLPSGGSTPYSYTYTGTLPPGLALNPSTGVVSGTPTATYASAVVTFAVQDASGIVANVTSPVRFTVGAYNSAISATANATQLALYVGLAMDSFSPLTPSGGQTPYTYSITSGTLPAGLSLDAATGAVTGTPTTTGSSNVVFSVQDSTHAVASVSNTVSFSVSALSSQPSGYVAQGGLVWMPVASTPQNYATALSVCAGSMLGESNWRLPTMPEVLALYNAIPSLNPSLSTQGWTLTNLVWTSTLEEDGYHAAVSLQTIAPGWWSRLNSSLLGVTCVH